MVDGDRQDLMCIAASMNARSLEELLLTYDDVLHCTRDRELAENVISRCEQIIDCMRDMIKHLNK